MSFRSRLLLFFTIIVVVPMGAVALVLFSITSQSEIGKADARIAEGLRVAFAVYRQDRAEATPQLRRIAHEPALQKALGAKSPTVARAQLARLINPPVAPALAAPTDKNGKQFGSLAVSTTTASSFVEAVGGLTDLDVRMFSRGRLLASTLNEHGNAGPPVSG